MFTTSCVLRFRCKLAFHFTSVWIQNFDCTSHKVKRCRIISPCREAPTPSSVYNRLGIVDDESDDGAEKLEADEDSSNHVEDDDSDDGKIFGIGGISADGSGNMATGIEVPDIALRGSAADAKRGVGKSSAKAKAGTAAKAKAKAGAAAGGSAQPQAKSRRSSTDGHSRAPKKRHTLLDHLAVEDLLTGPSEVQGDECNSEDGDPEGTPMKAPSIAGCSGGSSSLKPRSKDRIRLETTPAASDEMCLEVFAFRIYFFLSFPH